MGDPTDNLNINKREGVQIKEEVLKKVLGQKWQPLSLIMTVPNNYL